jgi:hypothetical protein
MVDRQEPNLNSHHKSYSYFRQVCYIWLPPK